MCAVINHLARPRDSTRFQVINSHAVPAFDTVIHVHPKPAEFGQTSLGNVIVRKRRHEMRILAVIRKRHRHIRLASPESRLEFMSLRKPEMSGSRQPEHNLTESNNLRHYYNVNQ